MYLSSRGASGGVELIRDDVLQLLRYGAPYVVSPISRSSSGGFSHIYGQPRQLGSRNRRGRARLEGVVSNNCILMFLRKRSNKASRDCGHHVVDAEGRQERCIALFAIF